jgi:segregation and condensation protein B
MTELKDILEALIFVHRGVLTGKVIEAVLKESFSPEEIARAMEELKEDCEKRGGVIRLLDVAGGYEFGTREDLAEWIKKMDHYEHHRRLSRPALETLAIVAYRQPVTRVEIESIRGVSVERILRNLLDKKLIRILGRKDVPGKPIVYGTTRDFLHYFGLKSLADLPALKEFADQNLAPEEGEEEGEEAAILPLEEVPSESGEQEGSPEDQPAGEAESEKAGEE